MSRELGPLDMTGGNRRVSALVVAPLALLFVALLTAASSDQHGRLVESNGSTAESSYQQPGDQDEHGGALGALIGLALVVTSGITAS